MKQTYYSNGKLLLTGEYVVLDGATALAVPTKKGQSLVVTPSRTNSVRWKSFTSENECWFEGTFNINEPLGEHTDKTSQTLYAILKSAQKLNPAFLSTEQGFIVETQLDFPQDWGLGSSSTLINNIAQWAQVDAFALLKASFGGSGYDIAAAQHNRPIFYAIKDGVTNVREVHLPWNFTASLYFVHLNKKQDSKDGISRYRNTTVNKEQMIQISDLTKKLLLCYTLTDFEKIMRAHERIISEIIGLPTVQDQLFSDYKGGIIKSLGAWGGDFILATGDQQTQNYFSKKGFPICIPFSEMIL